LAFGGTAVNKQVKGGLKPGDARCAAPSVQQIIDRDGDNPPAWYRENSYEFLGDENLTVDRYFTQEYHDLEMERMWSRVWQMACREEEIPEVGDNMVYDIGDWSFIIVRDAENSIKAFKNACLHRGTQLRAEDGSVTQFRCPFHGWTWNLDGSLKEIPCRWDFPKVIDEAFHLPEVKVGTWGGFVFINPDENCQPFEDYLGVLPQQMKLWPLQDRAIVANVRKVIRCNWKVTQEAFMESYHVLATHPQALAYLGDANSQYDIWGDHVSRQLNTQAVASPHLGEAVSQQAIADAMLMDLGHAGEGNLLRVPDGMTARQVIAKGVQDSLGPALGTDLSHLTISETLDTIEYFLFPNFHPWANITVPLVYRFRPNGNDPDSSIMDVLVMRPCAKDRPRPEPAPLHILRDDELFSDAPELGGLGAVFDQDTSNLERLQIGLKAAKKPGITLGNYQEARIRHIHQTLDKYLAG
jgi:phenylpropionate dioxygenase-like ring-hydroxylating dioxygenase large terminal subunit